MLQAPLDAILQKEIAAEISEDIEIVTGDAVGPLLETFFASDREYRPGNVFHHDGLFRAVLIEAADRAALAIVKRGECIESIWPLRFEPHYGLRIAVDLATPFAQYSDVIGAPLTAADFASLRTLLRDRFSVDAILCRNVRSDSGLATVLSPRSDSVIDRSTAPFVDLDAFGSFDPTFSK